MIMLLLIFFMPFLVTAQGFTSFKSHFWSDTHNLVPHAVLQNITSEKKQTTNLIWIFAISE